MTSSPRDTLIHLLTEAAEIEHNLLCSYLYAAFSLKDANDGLSRKEASAVGRWRDKIVGVAIEEMGHLALVNNLLVAVGGAAHFDRPNLPVAPGYHPAGFVIRLVPLTKPTLDHFIYLERPADSPDPEGGGRYRERAPLKRVATPGDLTPSTPDYETIGEFYAEIRSRLTELARKLGNNAFLEGSLRRQLKPPAVRLPGLVVIRTVDDALAALDTIVEQGEGASKANDNCHFSRFHEIREEWRALEAIHPGFEPARRAAHDPVMRRPEEGVDRVWITNPPAARLLDFGNALYGFALMLLEQSYAVATADSQRAALAKAAIAVMHPLATVGAALSGLRATKGGDICAGLTFAVPRNLRDMPADHLVPLCLERLKELQDGARDLRLEDVDQALSQVGVALEGLERSRRPGGPRGKPRQDNDRERLPAEASGN